MSWNKDRHPESPSDREVQQALADLPRERAADGFTDRVLRSLDETPPPARPFFLHFRWRHRWQRRWQPVLAGSAVAALLVAVLLATGVLRPASDPTHESGIEPQEPIFASADGPGTPGTEAPSVALPPETPETAVKPPAAVSPAAASDRRTETVARLEELRREHTRLVRDLRGLRELADGSQVIYIGGDESLDFVLDLQTEMPPAGGPDVRPATHRGGGGGGNRYF